MDTSNLQNHPPKIPTPKFSVVMVAKPRKKPSVLALTLDDLRKVQIFSALTERTLNELRSISVQHSVRPGKLIVGHRTPGEAIYFLLSGTAKVRIVDASGKEAIAGLLGAGEMIGEISILTGAPRTADVVALEKCRYLSIEAPLFMSKLERSPALAKALLKSLALRLKTATERISALALQDVRARIWSALISLSKPAPDYGPGVMRIAERPTHQTLAAIIGASRETVTRTLRELEDSKELRINEQELLLFPQRA